MAQTSRPHLRTHPFAQALRRAMDTRGVTLTWVRDQLKSRGIEISMATLSSWRSGSRRPEGPRSLEVVAGIERVLGLPEGVLTAALGPSLRTGRIGDQQFPWDDAALRDAAIELHEAFGADFPPPVRELTTISVTDVGAHGGIAVRRTQSLLQATADTRQYPLLEVLPWIAAPAPSFRVRGGGRVIRTQSHPSGRVHGALIELSQPLAAGETTMVDVEVVFAEDGPPVHETGHGVGRSIRELLLWIRFPSGAGPEWCNLVEERPGGRLGVTPLSLDRAGAGHAVRRQFGPGALGVHWGYE